MGLIETARKFLSRVQSTEDILVWLDSVVTSNEMGLEDLRSQIELLEGALKNEESKIKSKTVDGRQKKLTLLTIKRHRTHLLTIERRIDIFDRNITLGHSLIGKVKDMEAMALRGIEATQIDDIILEFEEKMNHYVSNFTTIDPTDSVSDESELDDLEKEILGEPEKDPPVRVVEATNPDAEFEYEEPTAEKRLLE